MNMIIKSINTSMFLANNRQAYMYMLSLKIDFQMS